MEKTTKYMLFSLVTNLVLSTLKIVFGIISKMKSMVADGIHSLSDLITDIIAIFGSKLSQKPADSGHPRGHGKIEYITGLIISLFIILLGVSIFKQSFNKSNTIPSVYLIIVVIITILAKFFLSRMLISKGKKINSMILISSGKESFTDVYSSLLVLIVIILSQFYKKFSFLKYSDMIGSILISILIIIMGLKLLFQNLSLLVGEAETDIIKLKQVKDVIKNRNDKFQIGKCTMYKIGSYYEITLTILVDGNMTIKNGHDLMDNIEKDLLESNLNIRYVMIHIEPMKEGNIYARTTRSRDSKGNIKEKSIRKKNKKS